MKAPNKIFVGFLFDIDFAISHAGCERIREDDKEYISKDVILEWANKSLEECIEKYKNGSEDHCLYAAVYAEIITKLESL